MATVVNRVASPALRGQTVLVSLDSSETTTKLPNVTLGQKATIGSSSYVGYVSSIDSYGSTFQISTQTPATNLSSSSTPGILTTSETITLA